MSVKTRKQGRDMAWTRGNINQGGYENTCHMKVEGRVEIVGLEILNMKKRR